MPDPQDPTGFENIPNDPIGSGMGGGGGLPGGIGGPATPEGVELDRILDIPLQVSVELGRNKISIQDLLMLAQGSVVELDKIAGEPLDVLVHNRLIARGEAVVVNSKFGVRLTDIVNPAERVAQLR